MPSWRKEEGDLEGPERYAHIPRAPLAEILGAGLHSSIWTPERGRRTSLLGAQPRRTRLLQDVPHRLHRPAGNPETHPRPTGPGRQPNSFPDKGAGPRVSPTTDLRECFPCARLGSAPF